MATTEVTEQPVPAADPTLASEGASECSFQSARDEDEFKVYRNDGAEPQRFLNWEDMSLPKPLLDGIRLKGYARPSKIQSVVLPLVLQSNDSLIAHAKNGAGKTACFCITILSKLIINAPSGLFADVGAARADSLQALIVSPSRELAVQNCDVLKELGKEMSGLKVGIGCPPDNSPQPGLHAISGTPGKLQDWIRTKKVNFRSLKVLVLDEADTMVDPKASMGDQVLQIAKSALQHPASEPDRQLLLFSATWPTRVRDLAKRMAPSAHRVEMEVEDLTLATTKQYHMDVSTEEEKLKALNEIYDAMEVGQSVVFCNKRETASKVANFLKELGHSVTLICGSSKGPVYKRNDGLSMDHLEREKRMNEFRDGKTRVLVTTDLLARGIDVQSVTLVINHELPLNQGGSRTYAYETYLHRVGRTGRFNNQGVAINLCCGEGDAAYIKAIEEFYKTTIPALEPDFDAIGKMVNSLRI